MKFAAGYLLGGLTVVGLGVSFCAGVLGMDMVYSKKNEMTKKADEATLTDLMKSYIDSKKN